MNTRRMIAAGLTGAIGLGAIGVGVASAQSDPSATGASTTQSAAQSTAQSATAADKTAPPSGEAPNQPGIGRGDPAGARGGNRLKNLAAALGIDESKLQTAMESIKPDGTQTPPSTDAERAAAETERDTKLASALGISVDDLSNAKAQAMTIDLQDDVTSGRLTQAQADEVKKLIESGDEQAAHDALHSIHEAEHLVKMVTDGTITQAQADEIKSRVAAGEDEHTVFTDVTGLTAPGPGQGHGPGDGQAPPADGQAPPADGQTPPADGQAPPAGAQAPTAGQVPTSTTAG